MKDHASELDQYERDQFNRMVGLLGGRVWFSS
jgi:hypothetical protein